MEKITGFDKVAANEFKEATNLAKEMEDEIGKIDRSSEQGFADKLSEVTEGYSKRLNNIATDILKYDLYTLRSKKSKVFFKDKIKAAMGVLYDDYVKKGVLTPRYAACACSRCSRRVPDNGVFIRTQDNGVICFECLGEKDFVKPEDEIYYNKR